MLKSLEIINEHIKFINDHRDIIKGTPVMLTELEQIKQDLNDYETLKSDYSYCNSYRRSLMKTIKGNGGCCKNCFWLCKYRDPTCGFISQYYCSATKWEIEIEEDRIDKCICHRFKYDKIQRDLNND